MPTRFILCCTTALAVFLLQVPALAQFTAFESGHVRPLVLSSTGDRLFVVNTPDNRLEIFRVGSSGLVHDATVPVGLEPVSVALSNDDEAWVVNHLSDSISIVDVSANPPRVTRTLLVGDEPRDIVFAGPGGNRAFITTAHRGQNSPWNSATNPGELTTPGIGRADVWVFDASSLGAALGGVPETVITLFGDTPRPLAVSVDGGTVYAGIFHSGNRTTTIHEGAVCDGGAGTASCTVSGATAPGGLPAPNVDSNNVPQPETGLIVRHDGGNWVDELGRLWDGLVRFDLPDKDVFAIDANANPPVETAAWSGVGTILYNMAVHPASGKVFVANTEALNETRFEGTRDPGDSTSTVLGHQHETRITVIDPGSNSVTPRHLNKHIDYSVNPAPASVADRSLALPRQLVLSSDGTTLYLAAKGSDKVGIFSTAAIEYDSFVPDAADHVSISGGGPAGLVLDEVRNRLYVTTRFDNGLSVIDLGTASETAHYLLHNPEPANLVAGRRFLYDARFTSSNGEAACASCHVDGDLDSLAWDLGDPDGSVLNNPLDPGPAGGGQAFHPMKGPMTTQTLRGMDGHGSMHWRGDRTGGNDEPNSAPNGDGGAYNEKLSFLKFNPAFVGLLGRGNELTATEMQQYADFILQVNQPPNPIRNLDNSMTPSQADGEEFYFNHVSDVVTTCNGCHVLSPTDSFFGTSGLSSFEGEPQHFKVPHLRNMYSKAGMFGMPAVPFFNAGNNGPQGDQIRGFGYLHDGSVDTLFRFFNAALFNFNTAGNPNITNKKTPAEHRRDMEQFMFAFDSNLKPAVGQQVTLDAGNCCVPVSDPDTNKSSQQLRAELLRDQALAGNADLIARGIQNNEMRGWRLLPADIFESDKAAEAVLSVDALFGIASQPGQPLSLTAVPPGDGRRIGIDRDDDSVLNLDDNCPAIANSSQVDTDIDQVGDACDNCPSTANTGQIDTDLDGSGDACDADDDNDGLDDSLEQSIGSNPLLTDTDGDGLSDFDEVAWDGDPDTYTPGSDLDPLASDTDGDGLSDANDPLPLVFHFNDGDVAPAGTPDGVVNAADSLVVMRVVLDLIPTDSNILAHADLYPAGAPDGVIDLSDLLLVMKLALQ